MQVKRKMSGGKSAHSFYSAPGIYHLLISDPMQESKGFVRISAKQESRRTKRCGGFPLFIHE